MATPDLGDVIAAAQQYGDDRAAAQHADDQVTLVQALAEQKALDDAALAALQAEFDLYVSTHPDPEPPPDPDPDPVAKKLIGMSAPANVWATRKQQVEATGGKLQARRIFLDSLGASLELVQAAHAEGLVPIVSWKVGTWAPLANGTQDAALKTLAGKLAALTKPVHAVFHHEPDQQSTPPDVGEGGTAADYARMQSHIIDVMRPLAPNVTFGVIGNGWWWTSQNRKLTDAQLEVWLPRSLRDKLDVVGADDYSPESGEEAVVKTKNRAAWARRVGGVKALGVGETNAFSAAQLRNVFEYAKSEPLFDGGYICVWNSTGDAYLPLTESGLLDDFQEILRSWA